MATEALLFDPATTDPYPIYHRLREEDPVHRSEALGAWILTRYEDVEPVLRDPRFSSDFGRQDEYDAETNMLGELLRKLMLFRDPPDHTRLRTLVNRAFTPRVVEALRPRIADIVDELLGAVLEKGEMDVIAELAYPLPVIVICELLGVPPSDRASFREWWRDMPRILDPVTTPEMLEEIIAQSSPGIMSFFNYFSDLAAERRRHPSDDLVSRLVAAEEEGDRLTEEDVLSLCGLLLIAGHETTQNLIGNGMLGLLRHPGELRALREDPALVRNAVEELLRYDSPVQLTARTALEPVEIGGTTIGARQEVIVLLGAANRDPARFGDPDRLDVRRVDVRHVAFGAGPHFCLGAQLARAEAQIAFEALLRRFSVLELLGEPEWRETITLRGLRSLVVSFEPA